VSLAAQTGGLQMFFELQKLEVKEQCKKTHTGRGWWVIVCFNFLGEVAQELLSSSSLISSSFWVHFQWFKTWWVHQLELYKNFFVFQEAKMQQFKDLSQMLWWWWSKERFSQIWLKFKHENKIIYRSLYIFGYIFEPCI
jgi:hypothetical protein